MRLSSNSVSYASFSLQRLYAILMRLCKSTGSVPALHSSLPVVYKAMIGYGTNKHPMGMGLSILYFLNFTYISIV